MLLTNHTLTGLYLGLAIDNPVELATAGVASHLVLDAVPHFGMPGMDIGTPTFIVIGAIDFTGAVCVTIAACLIWPQRLPNLIIGAIAADAPDLIYIPEMLFSKRRLDAWIPGYYGLRKFLGSGEYGGIQWYQKPPGLITEILWSTLMFWLLYPRLP